MKSVFPSIKRFPKVSPQEERKSRVKWARKLAEKLESSTTHAGGHELVKLPVKACQICQVRNELLAVAERDEK